MPSRKRVLKQIDHLDKEIRSEYAEKNEHKKKLNQFLHKNRLLISVLLIPVVAFGIKKIGPKRIVKIAKPLVNILIWKVLNKIK